jgi:hypothetical protein
MYVKHFDNLPVQDRRLCLELARMHHHNAEIHQRRGTLRFAADFG